MDRKRNRKNLEFGRDEDLRDKNRNLEFADEHDNCNWETGREFDRNRNLDFGRDLDRNRNLEFGRDLERRNLESDDDLRKNANRKRK